MIIEGKILLLTGGTGSFGQEFVRQALSYNPKSIRIYSRGELLQQQMRGAFKDDRLRFFIGDVRDRERLSRAMNGVGIVIHAAALKQVDTCEFNPIETIKTNILGSINVLEAAIDNQVERILAISSDKAVTPIGLYGATKLVMEKLIIHGRVYGKTKCGCVRLGNIWGSRGSVLNLWEEQYKKNGVIEITNTQMSRYWMTQEDAVKFSIRCLERIEWGEIYIPLLKPIKLEEIIGDLKYRVVGRRAGEKISEVLMSEIEKETAEYLEDCIVIR